MTGRFRSRWAGQSKAKPSYGANAGTACCAYRTQDLDGPQQRNAGSTSAATGAAARLAAEVPAAPVTRLDVGPVAETTRQALRTWKEGPNRLRGRAPVADGSGSLFPTCGAAGGIAGFTTCFGEDFGLAAIAAFDLGQIAGGGQLFTMRATREVARDLVVRNHRIFS